MASKETTASPRLGPPERRFLIEIAEWEWGLFLGMSPESTPVEYRFQGGLMHSRAIDIIGRLRAPHEHRHRSVRVSISPFGQDVDFGSPDVTDVGRLYEGRAASTADIEVTLDLPEADLQPTLICLSSSWKYLHVWTGEPGEDFACVTDFSFSRAVFPNLRDWAGAELDEPVG